VYFPLTDNVSGEGVKGLSAEKTLIGGTETILLADDEQIIRTLGESVLQNLGYSVITASNGAEAVKIYRKRGNEIALVVLDQIMPVMGGIEAYRGLKEINPDVKAILSSGYVIDDIQSLKDSGISGFLNKPFSMNDIAIEVRRVIDT